jgi:hypothetical protein|uniref:Uncharacterized protein n=1 Tax=Siphoviridae sp. ctGuJ10 TaxID=2825418 RepID=A0A8S5PSU9_9CAUD|nr:MAG TPA: hypothetical protein [Siphoviridae sp. ctGuJ10]
MIYTEIEKVLCEIVFAKEQEQRELTQAEQEIYAHYLEIRKIVEE